MKKIIALLLICLMMGQLISCKKDLVTVYDFSQRTVTDQNCTVTGTLDNTDWTYDSVWTAKEYSLLAFYYSDTLPQRDTLTGYIQIGPTCPNPSNGLMFFGYDAEIGCKMKLVCVNTSFDILHYETRILTGGPGIIAMDFRSNTSFKKPGNYRIYYGFYNTRDSLYYKGHGDLRIE